jgi:hypothetical protein
MEIHKSPNHVLDGADIVLSLDATWLARLASFLCRPDEDLCILQLQFKKGG